MVKQNFISEKLIKMENILNHYRPDVHELFANCTSLHVPSLPGNQILKTGGVVKAPTIKLSNGVKTNLTDQLYKSASKESPSFISKNWKIMLVGAALVISCWIIIKNKPDVKPSTPEEDQNMPMQVPTLPIHN